MMEGAIAPLPANPDQNADGDANQPDQNNDKDDNNAPTGPPNAPPNQPSNQPPNQPAPQPNQPTQANPAGSSPAYPKLATAFSMPGSPSNNTSTDSQ